MSRLLPCAIAMAHSYNLAIATAPLLWGVSVFAAMTGAESKTIFALVFYRMKQL